MLKAQEDTNLNSHVSCQSLSAAVSHFALENPKKNMLLYLGIPLFTVLVILFYVFSLSNWFETPTPGPQSSFLVIEATVSSLITAFSFFLCTISFLSYRREKSRSLLFVFSAAFLFAIKGILFTIHATLEYFAYTTLQFEPTAIILDFGILGILFIGLIKK